MRNIVECLAASVDSISKFAMTLTNASVSGKYTESEEEDEIYDELDNNAGHKKKSNFNQKFTQDVLKNIDQCLECFHLAVTLLARYVPPYLHGTYVV
jgi:hypothetical protein